MQHRSLRLIAGLALGASWSACKSSPAKVESPAQVLGATLDVASFEPPFGNIPVSRAFVARNHVARIWVHEVASADGPTVTARASELTEYDGDGAPVRSFTRSSDHDYELRLTESTAYVHVDPGVQKPPQPTAGTADSGPNEKIVVLDPAGRIVKILAHHVSSSVETYTYDASGHLTRVAHEFRRASEYDDVPTVEQSEEVRTYDPTGRVIKRTRGKVGAAPFETLEFQYDAAGRFSEWHGAKPGYDDDRYLFSYDGAGQLVGMRFQEGGKDIYERAYTYDSEGFLTRIELHSSVPAMSNATFVLAYELANGQKRSSVTVAVPGPPKQKTDDDVRASVLHVFHTRGTGSVTWDRTDARKPVLQTVTFEVPAPEVSSLTADQLKERACALRKALGYEECDCEYIERGNQHDGVIVLTFHVMLGC